MSRKDQSRWFGLIGFFSFLLQQLELQKQQQQQHLHVMYLCLPILFCLFAFAIVPEFLSETYDPLSTQYLFLTYYSSSSCNWWPPSWPGGRRGRRRRGLRRCRRWPRWSRWRLRPPSFLTFLKQMKKDERQKRVSIPYQISREDLRHKNPSCSAEMAESWLLVADTISDSSWLLIADVDNSWLLMLSVIAADSRQSCSAFQFFLTSMQPSPSFEKGVNLKHLQQKTFTFSCFAFPDFVFCCSHSLSRAAHFQFSIDAVTSRLCCIIFCFFSSF